MLLWVGTAASLLIAEVSVGPTYIPVTSLVSYHQQFESCAGRTPPRRLLPFCPTSMRSDAVQQALLTHMTSRHAKLYWSPTSCRYSCNVSSCCIAGMHCLMHQAEMHFVFPVLRHPFGASHLYCSSALQQNDASQQQGCEETVAS